MKSELLVLLLVPCLGCQVPSNIYHGFRLSSRHWAATLPERNFVQVTFDSVPSGAAVEVGEFYIGSGRVIRPLQVNRSFRVRLSKPGFETWTATIIAEDGLLVAPELTPLVSKASLAGGLP